MIPGLPIAGARIERLHRCRWCGREPEFQQQEGPHTKSCLYCQALQDPVLRLGNPITGVLVQFFVNPDASLFIEFTKQSNATDRYTLNADALRKMGVLTTYNEPVDGRK